MAETLKQYVEAFDYANKDGTDIKRKFLAHYVFIKQKDFTVPKPTGDNPEATETIKKDCYELLGYKVEDASVEFNWNEEKVTDITGVTYSSITKSEPEMSLEGYIINSHSEFLKNLSSMAIRNAYNEFSNFTIVTVYSWLVRTEGSGDGAKTYTLAKKETGCTIKPDSIGGQDYTRITPTIAFSNNAEYGTVELDDDTARTKIITFTRGDYTEV